MSDPTLVPDQALAGKRIAISASESADLARLGLSEFHCRLVIAELTRALILAGAIVTYTGHLREGGYTHILLDEAQRFGGYKRTLELILPESEYRRSSSDELAHADARLGEFGRLTMLDSKGEPIPFSSPHGQWTESIDAASSLSAARQYVSGRTDARVVVGGKLAGYVGREPGVIEEARLTLELGKPLLVAAGYGGAAAAVANVLGVGGDKSWQPEGYPSHVNDPEVSASLEKLANATGWVPPVGDLAASLVRTLAVSHRPADIASATIRLLSLTFA